MKTGLHGLSPFVITGSAHSSSTQGDYRRELFTVDGVRVTFDGAIWQCGCSDCAPGSSCTHIGEAQRFRRLRGTRPLEQPVQRAFDEPDFRAALEEVSVGHPLPEHSASPLIPQTVRPVRSGTLIAAAAAGVCFALFAYLAVEPPRVIATTAVAAPRPSALELRPTPDPPAAPTVTFANPFDPSETFEFPPGTSETEARDSAATFLLERARQRVATAAEPGRAL